MKTHFLTVFLAAALGSIVVIGCGGSKPANFYLLSAMSYPEPLVRDTLTIGIHPVEIPDYLRRSQIVSRTSDNSLELAEFDRWAEPLEENFNRVLRENLTALLGTERIIIYPWDSRLKIHYKIMVEIIQFEIQPDHSVTLGAHWAVSTSGPTPFAVETTRLTGKPDSPDKGKKKDIDYDAVASTMSELLAELSCTIADSILAHTKNRIDTTDLAPPVYQKFGK